MCKIVQELCFSTSCVPNTFRRHLTSEPHKAEATATGSAHKVYRGQGVWQLTQLRYFKHPMPVQCNIEQHKAWPMIEWFESRWHNPQKVVLVKMEPYIKDILDHLGSSCHLL